MKIFVIRTDNLQETLEFFTKLGLSFTEEKHGDGPVHYACENNDLVFELYPSKNVQMAE